MVSGHLMKLPCLECKREDILFGLGIISQIAYCRDFFVCIHALLP